MATATLERKLVSAKTLGRMLDIRETTIRAWGREGKLSARIIGGRLMRFDLQEALQTLGLAEKD